MKRILNIFVWMLFVMQVMAIPADSKLRTVTQPDGSSLMVRLYGDESYHFFVTADGQVVVEGANGGWYYAEGDDEESLHPSAMMAHDADKRGRSEKKFLNEREVSGVTVAIQRHISRVWTEKNTRINKNRNTRRAHRILDFPGQYIGKKRGLVILVEFANLSMASSTSQQDYEDRFNKKGYTQDGHVGSVSDYFRDQSYGVFELSFDVVGPVRLSRNYGYYGTDGTGNGGHDLHSDEMIREACQLADPYVNFSDYDWNHDGEADQVYVIYAGYGQATGGASNTIWPHESHLEYTKDGTIELDGITINTFACSNELYGENRERYMGIGTACHEFSHCLGLPDTYDTDYSGAFGMGDWGVMNGGSYNGPNGCAEVPCGYTAFERWYVGWLEMKDILMSQWVTALPDLEQAPVAYRMRSENHEDEYFIFENRQGTKWFKYLGQTQGLHGMLVTHIDYSLVAWTLNEVNPSPSLQRMTIIPADGNYDETSKGQAGDLFPGTEGVTSIDNKSHYNVGGKLNHANADGTFTMNATISQITESEEDGNISFCAVLSRDLATPHAIAATWERGEGLRFKWNRALGAQSYDVQMLKVTSRVPFRSEHIEVSSISTNYYDCDVTDYQKLFLRVRSHRGNLYSDWSSFIEAEGIPEGIEQITDDVVSDTYYSINGQRLPQYQHKGIVINGSTQKKYIPLH